MCVYMDIYILYINTIIISFGILFYISSLNSSLASVLVGFLSLTFIEPYLERENHLKKMPP